MNMKTIETTPYTGKMEQYVEIEPLDTITHPAPDTANLIDQARKSHHVNPEHARLFLKQATQCVTAHLDDSDFGQETFSREMNCSKSTLYRRIKILTGFTTPTFIRKVRLRAAKFIMDQQNGHVSLKDLTYAVGFSDCKYFNNCFREEYGIMPSQYARLLAGI